MAKVSQAAVNEAMGILNSGEKENDNDIAMSKKVLKKATPEQSRIAREGLGMKNGGGVKPDYIDIDGDGNKKESMKSAASQKKNKGMMGGGYVKPKKMGHGGMAYRGRNYAYGGRVAKYKG